MDNKENQDLLITEQIDEEQASENSDASYSNAEIKIVSEYQKPKAIKNNSHFFREQKPENMLNKRNQNAISRIQNRKSNTLNKKSSLNDPTNIKQQQNMDQSDRLEEKPSSLDNAKDKVKQVGQVAKDKVKNATKQGVKQTGKAAGGAAKKAGSAAAKGIVSIATNPVTAPYFWGAVLTISLILFVPIFISVIFGNVNDSSSTTTTIPTVNSAISLTHTKLSKEEFVSYCNKQTSHTEFYSKCDVIYDISQKNNFNPEMVVIRAYVEGFSPGASNNNYWGIGCYNGYSSSQCASYASFEDGVKAFIKNVSKYKTVEEMVGKYAYIGDYWYNPGGSGQGGCYYFPYMRKYMTEIRASIVEKYCAANARCAGANCHPTTSDDQYAYSRYQTETMVKAGETLFGGVTADVASSTEVDGSIPRNIDDLKNRYYFTFDLDNYFPDNQLFGQCVWYAKHRAMDIIASSNLSDKEKADRIKVFKGSLGDGRSVATTLGRNPLFTSTTDFNSIKAPAVISWTDGSYGHVGIIESITTDESGKKIYYVTDAGRKRSNGSWYTVNKANAWSVLLFPIGDSTHLSADNTKNRSGQTFVAATSILE